MIHTVHMTRRVASVVCGLLAVSAVMLLAGASAANARIAPPNSTRIFHMCRELGNDGTDRGVVCADLMSVPDGDGTTYFGQNDIYCQSLRTRGFVRCGGIHETPAIGRFWCVPLLQTLCQDGNQRTFGGGQQICGRVFGHSPCAVQETVHVAIPYTFEFFVRGRGDNCTFWGESVRTSIRMPSGKTFSINTLATRQRTVSCDDDSR